MVNKPMVNKPLMSMFFFQICLTSLGWLPLKFVLGWWDVSLGWWHFEPRLPRCLRARLDHRVLWVAK